jgi:hypothetical protein
MTRRWPPTELELAGVDSHLKLRSTLGLVDPPQSLDTENYIVGLCSVTAVDHLDHVIARLPELYAIFPIRRDHLEQKGIVGIEDLILQAGAAWRNLHV